MQKATLKGQSAMEYLMTYGWSILIIAIALVVLFELGVFNTSLLSGSNTCIAQSGYLCSQTSLATNGILSAQVGNSYGTITITGVTCTTSTQVPTSSSFNSISPVKINDGETTSLDFYCPLSSNTIGTPFNGKLWIIFTSGSSSQQIGEVGVVSAKSSVGSSSAFQGVFSTGSSVPITLTNQQSSGTQSNFQQMIYFNPSTYSSYENSNLSNMEFTSGSSLTNGGTPLYAWIESGASSSAANTVVWVNLGSTTLGANNNYISVNVINSQSTATGTNFQQMISFNALSYSSYEASNLGNIRFYAGSTELYSWCESGCSSTSSNAIFWVNTGSLSIGASSYATVNMIFEPTSTEYDGVYAGEAPQLSSTYAQYDNGGNVFTNYWNFAGTSLPSGWQELTSVGDSYSVNNGITFTNLNSGSDYVSVGTTSAVASSGILEVGITSGSNARPTIELSTSGTQIIGQQPINMYEYGYGISYGMYSGDLQLEVLSNVYGNEAIVKTGYNAPLVVGIGWPSTGNQLMETYQTGYQNVQSVSVTNTLVSLTTPLYVMLGQSASGSSSDTGGFTANWLRVRSYPPNGVMPTVQFSSVQTGNPSSPNTATIYMNFLSSNSPVSSGYTGYAPQLYCTSGCEQSSYAQYDNGGSVFSFYDASPTGSKWTTYGSGQSVTTSANNGDYFKTTNALVTTLCGGGYTTNVDLNSISNDAIVTFWLYAGTSGNGGTLFFPSTSTGDSYGVGLGTGTGFETGVLSNRGGTVNPCDYAESTNGYYSQNTWYQNQLVLSGNTVSYYLQQSSSSTGIESFGTKIGSYQYGYTPSGNYITIGSMYPNTGSAYFSGFVVRQYPPNGVMPEFNLGSVSS